MSASIARAIGQPQARSNATLAIGRDYWQNARMRALLPLSALLLATAGEAAPVSGPASANGWLGDLSPRVANLWRAIRLPPISFRTPPPRSRYSVTVAIGPPRRLPPLPRILGTPGRPLVVIDPGHGGHDPGAISPYGGQREKDTTLAIARTMRDALLSSGRVRVALTRDTDSFIVLEQRHTIARRLKADLFISIHADSAGNAEASGATVYTLSEVASDREAARLAARENRADVLGGVNLGGESREVSSILLDLTQRETMNISSRFANLLKRESAPLMPFRGDFHRFAAFVVLKSPDTPSVLFETGFLSNAEDVKFLSSPEGRDRIARGATKAIETHFARQLATR